MTTSSTTTSETERPNVEYGDYETALGNEILRTEVGSGLHGIAIAGTDDHDEMGIFVEPPGPVLGIAEGGKEAWRDSVIKRTQPEGARSGPGDTDLVMYGLRKYLRLAVHGNATVLLPMFAPDSKVLVDTMLGRGLRSIRKSFLSADAVERFLSYCHAQHDRMLGYGKRNRVPNRPELVERYGYDVKYAAHALRLAWQGLEIARYGTLTLPMMTEQREAVLAIKQGDWRLEDVSGAITRATVDINRYLSGERAIAVPPKPDMQVIDEFSRVAHLTQWRMKGYI